MQIWTSITVASAAALLSAGIAGSATAQGYGDWTGPYAGLSVGFGDGAGSPVIDNDLEGWTYGIHGGYLYDMGSIVLGGEASYSGSDVSGLTAGGEDVSIDNINHAKLRFGYDAGAYQPYVTGGWAQMTTSGALEGDDDGAVYGFGVDYLYGTNIVVGVEALWHEFDDFNDTGVNLNLNTWNLRASYRF